MAENFWRKTKRPLLSALVAAWVADILKKRSEGKFDTEFSEHYAALKK